MFLSTIRVRRTIVFTCALASMSLCALSEERSSYPSFDYDVARAHEIKPHRREIPLEGVSPGFHQLRLTLTVSPSGEVLDAKASGDRDMRGFWPQLQGEVRQWKFVPFQESGKVVTAEVEEYIDLVPPERLPTNHVEAPVVEAHSVVTIALARSGCYGNCPSYTVTVSANGIVFDGGYFVVARGKHTDSIDADDVRKLARSFVAADFYSLDASYSAVVTDMPGRLLSITIDGQKKEVEDYVGSWVGMPSVVTELEDAVDKLARTERWVSGSDGLVEALEAEKFNFQSFDAQVMLKAAASRGCTATVREFLAAGVPLKPLAPPMPKQPYMSAPLAEVGWLNAASGHLGALQVLINAKASEDDQSDKDLALVGAAGSGDLTATQALIAYGANPNADLSKLTVTDSSGGMTAGERGAGSVLIYAAKSGNPDIVREILHYHPRLEKRDSEGQTAMFAAGDYRDGDKDGARLERVRLLARAGANVNARDNDGNTPLHETFLTDVEEELLKLGADVNARNKDGETPIFTTVDNDAIPLFIRYGADLAIRNKKGETVIQAAKGKGPLRQEALRKAIEKSGNP